MKKTLILLIVFLMPGFTLAQGPESFGQGPEQFEVQPPQQGGAQDNQAGGNQVTTQDPLGFTVGEPQGQDQQYHERVIRYGDYDRDKSQYESPEWEKREYVEQAAKEYFQAKHSYNQCKATGDTAGMRRAAARMTSLSRQLDAFKKEQAERDRVQDEKIKGNTTKIDALSKQINDEGGINDQLNTTKRTVGDLQKEMNDYITPAIAGTNGKFDRLTWWLFILTVIVAVGFTRRFWILVISRMTNGQQGGTRI